MLLELLRKHFPKCYKLYKNKAPDTGILICVLCVCCIPESDSLYKDKRLDEARGLETTIPFISGQWLIFPEVQLH